jgi:hypothetical protein
MINNQAPQSQGQTSDVHMAIAGDDHEARNLSMMVTKEEKEAILSDTFIKRRLSNHSCF